MLIKATSAAERLEDPLGSRRRPSTSTATDIALDSMLLEGRRLESNIADSITDATLARTIEGASTLTLTVNDTDRILLESGLFLDSKDRLAPLHLSILGPKRPIHFLLAKLAKSEDALSLTFEDREIAWLRRYDKPKKAYRDATTRAEFVLSLVREVKEGRIRTYIPELHKRQPQKGIRTKTDQPKEKSEERAFGLSKNLNLKIKGVRATPFQLHNVERALNVGANLNAPELALMASLVAGIGESNFRFPVNSLGYGGVFQGQVETGGRYFKKDDVEGMARSFFLGGKGFQGGGAIKLAKANPHMSPGTIAVTVEDSGVGGAFYDKHKDEARALLTAYGHKRLKAGGTVTGSVVKRFAFTRGTGGKKEDSWTAIQRLAEEVGWRAFMNEGVFYFVSEDDLFNSRAQMVINEDAPGVDWIDYDIDVGKHVSEATVRCRAGLWSADPGTAVVIDEEGSPASGEPWIVSTVSRGLYDPACEVSLKRPAAPKREPAPETESKTISRSESRRGKGEKGSAASLKERCKVISDGGGGYDYGGGHGPPLKDLKGSQGLDCSSSTSLALYRAGLFPDSVAWVSGRFASSYGKPGRGKEVTIWANDGHVFIQGNGWRFDTGGPGGGSGPKLHNQTRSTAGFTPRHPDGL